MRKDIGGRGSSRRENWEGMPTWRAPGKQVGIFPEDLPSAGTIPLGL